MKQQNRARLKLIGVFALFFVPLAAAYILYYSGIMSGSATNEGVLLKPVEPLPTVQLTGSDGATTSTNVLRKQWTYLQVAPDGCGSDCRKSLKETRHIWLLLHHDRARVQRVLFVGKGSSPKFDKQPLLEVYSGQLTPLWTTIKRRAATRPGTVFLIDPHGNWVLYYPPKQNGKGLFDDTRHLLRLSNIG